MTPPLGDDSSSSPADRPSHSSRKAGRRASRNATSSASNARSASDQAKSTKLTLPSPSVEFTLSAEQEALRDTVRAVLARESPLSLVRARADADDREPSPAWSRI